MARPKGWSLEKLNHKKIMDKINYYRRRIRELLELDNIGRY